MSDLKIKDINHFRTYYKEEVGGLVMGGYENNPIPWAVDGIPEGFHYTLLDSNFDHFEPMIELALGRVPALQTAVTCAP